MKNIAIFASGSGSNAENLIRYFSAHPQGTVRLVLSNKAEAGAIERAARLGVESMVFDRDTFYNSEQVLARLRQERIDFVVLAGFLWLVPDYLIAAYPDRIVNIHPALLPKYGGKGMYGDRVHQAVVEAGEKESGITIHRVNGQYDSGDIIAQHRVPSHRTTRRKRWLQKCMRSNTNTTRKPSKQSSPNCSAVFARENHRRITVAETGNDVSIARTEGDKRSKRTDG